MTIIGAANLAWSVYLWVKTRRLENDVAVLAGAHKKLLGEK
jgi:hypothetical protein